MIRHRDSIYGKKVVETIRALGIEEKVISYQSPSQNGYVERMMETIRQECLDHVIVFSEPVLRGLHQIYWRQAAGATWRPLPFQVRWTAKSVCYFGNPGDRARCR